MTVHTDESIEHFLDAIGQVHGADYKDRMSVAFCGGHYFKVKYPHQNEAMLVPAGYLDLMTRDLLDHPDHHQSHHRTNFSAA